EAGLGWEGRLVAGLAPVPLDRVEKGRLFAADISAGAAPDFDIEGQTAAEGVFAEKAAIACLLDGVFETPAGQGVFAADVDVAALAAGRVTGDRHRLDHREGVLLHDHAVLEGAGLRLVG